MNGIFQKTKDVIYKVVEKNAEKDHVFILNEIRKILPNVPIYVIESCLEDILKEE